VEFAINVGAMHIARRTSAAGFPRMRLVEWSARDADEHFVLKPRVHDGHRPLWVDDALRLNQSNVILTHLAEQHGLIGDSPRWR